MRRTILAVVVLVLAGCAEASSEVNTPDAWDSIQADPALIDGAERALTEAPPPAEGWRIGVVLAEAADTDGHAWSASILTDAGPAVVTAAYGCSDEEYDLYGGYAVDVLTLTVDPGDLVTWSLVGDDARVCASEFEVLRKGAARRGGSDG